MSNELALLDDFENMTPEEMMALSGQSASESGASFDDHFLKASINLKRKINDKAAPNPAYQFYADGSQTFLTDDVEFIFLGKGYLYRVYDSQLEEYTIQSQIVDKYYNVDIMDTAGGFNAGNMGYLDKDQFEGLTESQRKTHLAAKRTIKIHALVRGKGKTLDGEPVDLDEWTPVSLYVSRSVAPAYEDVFKQFTKARIPAFLKVVKLDDLDIGMVGSFEIGVPKFKIDMESSVDVGMVKPHIKERLMEIEAHNEWVQREHLSAHKENNEKALDVKFVEIMNEDD